MNVLGLLRSWVASPSGLDPDASRLASTVLAICVAFIIAATISISAALSMIHSRPIVGLFLGAVSVAWLLGARALVRARRVRAAAWAVVALVWTAGTSSITMAGELNTPGFSTYTLGIVAAGLLLGGRAAIAMAIASAATSAGMGWLQSHGIFAQRVIGYPSPVSAWWVEITLFAASAGLVVISVSQIRSALEEARRSGAVLAQRNRELDASREQYRAITENASDLIAELDAEGRCRYVSPNARSMLGMDPFLLRDRPFMELLHEEDQPRFATALATLSDTGFAAPTRLEMRIRGPNGAWRYVETGLSHFRDVRGERRIVSTSRDVTARVRAADAEARLHAAMDQAGEGILVMAPEGRILYANSAFEHLSDRDGAELIGADAAGTLRDVDGGASDEIRETIAWGETWRGRIELGLADGSRAIRDATVAAVRDRAGRTESVVAVVRDVTREMALEEELRQAHKMEAVGQLAGGVAHDFNNLLVVIAGYAKLLSDRLADDPKGLAQLGQIDQAVDRAADLTGQLLAFGRRQVTRPRLVNLNEVTGRAMAMLDRLLHENVEIHTELDPDLDPVRVDPSQMQQILFNLAANARDAMPEGGRLTLRTFNAPRDGDGADDANGWVVLTLSDTGLGMDAPTRRRIFEPFFTTKELGKGTGLGLASVYGIVEQCGGTIDVESELGKGTTFRIRIPAVCATETSEPAPAPPESAPSPGLATILVVEDEDGVRRLIRHVLESRGHRVVEARNGEEALALVGSPQIAIDLVLTDVMMPRVGGPQLVAGMRKKWPDLVAVYMSGYPRDEMGDLGDSSDRVHFLPKPFHPTDLLSRIDEILGTRRSPSS